MRSFSESYRAAGVDITAGYEGVRLMKKHVQRTMIPGVVSDLGGFGGLFAPDLTGMKEPVLVSGTDGVGTKQRIAQLMDKHDTVGIDCVAMCVNDIICCGAKPIFFLDYIAIGKNDPEKVAALVSGTDGVGTKQRIAQLMDKHDPVGIDCVAMCVNDIICCGAKPIFFLDYIAIGKNDPEKVATLVSGVAEGCVQSGCALIGGETAEHPGTMQPDDYELAGFSVGIVDKSRVLDHSTMQTGDVVLALPSSGLHSNGYSLVRKVFDVEHTDLGRTYDELGTTLGEALLTPTVIYVKPVLAALEAAQVRGISHITGGGFYENIPRAIPDGLCAKIEKAAIHTPAIFGLLQRMGSIPEHDMFNTYNMGVGMTMVVSRDTADAALSALKAGGCKAYAVGEIVTGQEKVVLC